MSKQDANGVRTAQDIERKYDFASFLGLKKNYELMQTGLTKIENELTDMLNAFVINLKNVLDSQSEVSLWFYSGVPTLQNEPYINWQNKDEHEGDLYYDKETGNVYQFKCYDENYVWESNVSPDLVQAMALTNAESDTSEDHERKIFINQPTPPYSNGDWWIKDDGSFFICQISKQEGEFSVDDFINSSNYTPTIAEQIEDTITVLKGCVTKMTEDFVQFTDLSTGGSTIIAGDNIKTGEIRSNNYVSGVSGTKISLTDGSIDSKNFKLDSQGNIIATNGKFSGDITTSNANITGGTIDILSTRDTPKFIIKDENSVTKLKMNDGGIEVLKNSSGRSCGLNIYNGLTLSYNDIGLLSAAYSETPEMGPYIGLLLRTLDYSKSVSISPNGVNAPAFNNNSLESLKKNINKFKGALNVIKNTDIYSYNWKNEEDIDKKHYGMIIGNKYRTPQEFISSKGDGIDTYATVSICLQAIKEQQKEIEDLKTRINEMEAKYVKN